jgi:hypothetical protein
MGSGLCLAQEVDAISNSFSVTPHQFVLPYKTIRNCPIYTSLQANPSKKSNEEK